MSTERATSLPALTGRAHYPNGATAAVAFSIDDVHPARSSDGYEAGGDLARGVLGRLARLVGRHPALKLTLFVAADWQERSVDPTRRLLAALPWIRNRLYLAERWTPGTMALDRHPDFVTYLKALPRVEVAPHGLTHTGRGLEIPQEFRRMSASRCERTLAEMERIFDRAGLRWTRGFAPPGWAVSEDLLRCLVKRDYRYIQCSRDLDTPIGRDARCSGLGLSGLPLLLPEPIQGTRLVHIPVNWSATSDEVRAIEILKSGGVLSIKGHAVLRIRKRASTDGLDERYCDKLDRLFSRIEREYGSGVWWCHLSALAERFRDGHEQN